MYLASYLGIWLHQVLVLAPGLSCSEACGILTLTSCVEPTFPALKGRLFTTETTGKSLTTGF